MAKRKAARTNTRGHDGQKIEVRVIRPMQQAADGGEVSPPMPAGPPSAPAVPKALIRELGILASAARSGQGDLPAAFGVPPETSPKDLAAGMSAESDLLEDPELDQAVDQIVAREGDELLAMDDAGRDVGSEEHTVFGGGGSLLGRLWRSRTVRIVLGLMLIAALTAAVTIPKIRYAILNQYGVRASASLTVTDISTQQPLAGVPVQLGTATVRTDANGTVRFAHARLGSQTLRLAQPGFAIVDQPVTLGWGSNPLGAFTLTPTGTQYTIRVQDYFSGKPLTAATATVDGASTLANKQGVIVLSLAPPAPGDVPAATIAASGYRSQTIALKQDGQPSAKVTLTPTGKDVFFAKENGTYNVYACDLDGQNQALLLAGTGSETASSNAVAVDPASTEAAVVSLRNNQHDGSGTPLYSLTLVGLGGGGSQTIDGAEQIRLIDWQDTTLIYELTMTSAPASNPARSRIVSFNYATNVRVQLAAAGEFSVAMSGQGVVYYADSPNDPNGQPGLFAVNPDDSGRQTVTGSPVLRALRADYNTLDIETAGGLWQTYMFGSSDGLADGANPGAATDRFYAVSANGQRAAWIGPGAGNQPALSVYDVGTNKDSVLQTTGDVAYPLYWTGEDVLVYRVGGSQTADYAVSIDGGAPHKIIDVAPAAGFTQGT